MTEQGYNYLDGSVKSMAEFLRQVLKIEQNQSLQVFPQKTEKERRKVPRKGKPSPMKLQKDEDSDKDKNTRFCKYHGMCRFMMSVKCLRY